MQGMFFLHRISLMKFMNPYNLRFILTASYFLFLAELKTAWNIHVYCKVWIIQYNSSDYINLVYLIDSRKIRADIKIIEKEKLG